MVTYDDLRNGDLLVWEDSSVSKGKWDYLKLVRLLTMSNFGHVSTAVIRDGQPYHIEAVSPKIHMTSIPRSGSLYVVQMNLGLSFDDMGSFYQDKIGLPYGTLDAIRAWLGWTLKDENKWQCAELCLEFYRHLGLLLPDAFTPRELVKVIMEQENKPLLKLVPN